MQLFRQRRPWGLEITGFGRPMGLGLDGQGRVLVTDMDCHVLVRFEDGLDGFRLHAGIGHGWSSPAKLRDGRAPSRPARRPGGWNGPHAVTQDAEGRLLVTCYHDPMVAALDPVSGRAGVLIGKDFLRGPATARVDARGRILVSEYALNLLMAFDAEGGYLGRIGHEAGRGNLRFDAGRTGVAASSMPGGFDRLHMAAAAPDGSLVVADTWNDRLQRFSAAGEFIACLQDGFLGWQPEPAPRGAAVGHHRIACPVALDFDGGGRMLVTAWDSGEVLLFGRDGRRLPMAPVPALEKPYDARFHGGGMLVADTHHGRILLMDNVDPPRAR